MKLSAIPRITLGLVSLSVALLLAFDLLLHLFPSEADTTRDLRTRVTTSLAVQAAALVQARDMATVERTLAAVQSRDPEMLSIGLRRADGALVAQAGEHPRHWGAENANRASANAFSIVLLAGQQRWGSLEIAFRPIHQRPLSEWWLRGPTQLLFLFSLGSGLLYFAYLRRMLKHLDPSAAVPERVRGAFDSLTEGVFVVDPQENILLANQSFQALGPAGEGAALLGKKASGLAWLSPVATEGASDATPWLTAMRTRSPLRGRSFEVLREGEPAAKVVINCSPLLDEKSGVRGCLITVDDVTALERSHGQLLEVLADLAASKQLLEIKNTELVDLANRDPLSGCLNRRAFYAGLESLFAKARRETSELICIMADIDHFKSINDRFGHAVGDEAIKAFAGILRASVRPVDLLGRYGGEEFCIVVTGMSLERAMQLADTMRQRLVVERSAGQSSGHDVRMSASFGVSSLRFGAKNEAGLVDQADQAMYIAKQTGRNRVVAFTPKPVAQEQALEVAAP